MSKGNYDKIFKIFRDSLIDATISSLNEIKNSNFKNSSTWVDKRYPKKDKKDDP